MPRKIDFDAVNRLFAYDPGTGLITRKVTMNTNNARAGDVVGSRDKNGYLKTTVSGQPIFLHRMAWAMYYGVSPTLDIDHINGIVDDNRIANLREVPRHKNLQNQQRAHRDSKSGYLGVHPYCNGRWQARIYFAGQTILLGYFDDPKVAHEHYLVAKRMLHPGCTI